MGSALLSRFDLVFILLDTPNEDHDHLLSEHVMAIRAGKRAACSSAVVTRTNSQDRSVLEVISDRPLLERLKVGLVLWLLLCPFLWCSLQRDLATLTCWMSSVSHSSHHNWPWIKEEEFKAPATSFYQLSVVTLPTLLELLKMCLKPCSSPYRRECVSWARFV